MGRRPEAARYSSVASTRRSMTPGADVLAAALVDVDARVGEHAALERLLAHEQDLADRGRLGVGADERVACRRRGRSRSTRAASSRRGSAWGRSAGRRLPAGRISKRRCEARRAVPAPMRPRMVPPMTRAPLRSGLATKSLGVEADEVVGGGLVGVGGELLLAAGGAGARRARGWRTGASLATARRRAAAAGLGGRGELGRPWRGGGPWRCGRRSRRGSAWGRAGRSSSRRDGGARRPCARAGTG